LPDTTALAESGRPARAHAPLAHHFENLAQQREASTLGMWIFLVTEVLFFGGLFAAYAVYRALYPDAFAAASSTLDLALGTVNTVVLIASSLTMALAVHAAQTGGRRALVLFLLATIALGTVFLGIKGVEYAHKLAEHHVPGPGFHFDVAAYAGQAQMFFALYFAMTGLHALHMVIGLGVVGWMAWLAGTGRITPEYFNPVEVTGLYWHFVDIVWIFLFPLLYLIGRHG
jgi:cytochrome c oxidase subunit 3